MEAACTGAVDEMAALDASLPAELSPETLRPIRAPRGFIIVPTDDPGMAYIFPNAQLSAMTPGLAAIRVVSATLGRVDIVDAGGQTTQLQVGVAGGRPMMRVLREGGAPLVFVGCASSIG
jgi:hypothetical protein